VVWICSKPNEHSEPCDRQYEWRSDLSELFYVLIRRSEWPLSVIKKSLVRMVLCCQIKGIEIYLIFDK
jgi:hypothetical protein